MELKIKHWFTTSLIVVSQLLYSQSISFGEAYDFIDPTNISFELITTGLLSDYTFPAPEGVIFNNTGTKLYVTFEGVVSQYSVATPFDLSSTISFDGDVNLTEETDKRDMVFSADGNSLFIVGTNGATDHIEQYSLSSSFDITSTITYSGSYSIGATNPVSITFNDVGTKMYVIAASSGPTLHQYSLSTPYNVLSGVSSDGTVDLTDVSFAGGLNFNHDGTLMFVLDDTDREIDIYQLSISFDALSTITLEASYDISANNTAPTGIDFSSDGQKFYVIGSNFDDVSQYAINARGGFVETASNTGEVEGSLLINLNGDTFTNAGGSLEHKTHFAISNAPAGLTIQALVSANGTTATITFSGSANSSESSNDVSGLIFTFVDGAFTGGDASAISNSSAADSGFGIDFDDNTPPTLEESFMDQNEFMGFDFRIFDLENKFDDIDGHTIQLSANSTNTAVATVSISNEKLTVSQVSDGTATISVTADDGQGGQISDDFVLTINESEPVISYGQGFDLSNGSNVSHDVTTAGLLSSITLPSPEGLSFNDDGTRLFVLFKTYILQFGLATPFDMNSTATDEGYTVLGDESSMRDMTFNNDGTKLYVTGESSDAVHQYSLYAPYDVKSGMEHDGQYGVGSINPYTITFSSDGFKMFVIRASGGPILNQYSLSTAFDVTSTVTSDGSLSLSDVVFAGGVHFNLDGTQMMVLDQNADDVEVYDLSNNFDITSGVSNLASYSVSGQHNQSKGIEFNYDGSKFYVIGSGVDDVSQYSVAKTSGGFSELGSNNGAVEGNIVISSNFDSFINAGGSLESGVDYQIDNLPSGLIANLQIGASGRNGVLTLSGNSSNHQNANDIADLQFTFENSAFEINNASNVANSIAASSNYGIDFLINSETDILSFVLAEQATPAIVDAGNHTVNIEVINGTDRTALTPIVAVSDGANYTPQGVQDISSDLTITVTAEDGATQDWLVSVLEADNTWNGTNWSSGSAPTSTDDVVIDGDYSIGTDGYFDSRDLTINSGATMTVDGESSLVLQRNLINNGTLVVESGSSLLTYSPNTITGNDITFKRNTRYADGRYSFVGSPVEQDASIVGSDLGTSVYKYNEATAYGADGISRWEDASTDELVPGKGYTQAFQQEITFTGMPNQGTITIDGSYTEDSNDDYEGWVLVSNPYPAAIDVADFLSANTNTTGSIYIWDDNGSDSQRGTNTDYIVANGFMATNTTPAGGQTRYDQIMGSMQGFFVKLNSAADVEIEFREDMRVTSGNTDDHFFRKTALPIARINLTNNSGLFKQAVIGFAEDATENNLNTRYDAQAFNATSEFGLFTMKAGRSLTLNGMTSNWENVQLQLNTKEAGLYTISLELEGYDQALYLRDNLTGKVTDLATESYSFTSETGINTERFELISNPNEVLGLEEAKVLVYAHNSILYIRPSDSESREFQLFNMQGRQLMATTANGSKEVNLQSFSSGVYLVFDGNKTHKIILK